MEKSIVVPWDFSKRAEASFQHAMLITKIMVRDIVLLHVVTKESEKNEAEDKLNLDAERLLKTYGKKPKTICKIGDIFNTINDFCEEITSPLVVMPLHNSKRAIKVIVGSTRPFYLVQHPPKTMEIKNIIVPIDHYEENRVQLNWVLFLAKIFKSNINIIKPHVSGNQRSSLMKKNIFFAKQLMDPRKIKYGIHTGNEGDKFHKTISNYTKEINGDLIFMMSYNFKEYMEISEKDRSTAPVLCLNPKSLKFVPDKY